MTKPILSLQLFSMRGLGSLDVQLSEAARAGFRHVEPLETHLRDVDALKDGLLRHGLTAPTAHIGLDALRKEPQRFVEVCRACGIGQLFVPHSSSYFPRETAKAWQRLGHELGALSEQFRAEGITLGYHNKTDGFTFLFDGRYGFELMFEAAQGSPLTWQADIAWISRTRANPVEWLQRYAKVLVSAHVKDLAPEGTEIEEDGWSDVGSGILVWPLLWRSALANGAQTLVVEHDNPHQPFEFAERSFTYLSRFMA